MKCLLAFALVCFSTAAYAGEELVTFENPEAYGYKFFLLSDAERHTDRAVDRMEDRADAACKLLLKERSSGSIYAVNMRFVEGASAEVAGLQNLLSVSIRGASDNLMVTVLDATSPLYAPAHYISKLQCAIFN